MTTMKEANEIAKAEGGIYRIEPCANGVPAVKIVVAEEGENQGSTVWQGPVHEALAEVRRMSIATRVLRTQVPELGSY